MTMDIDKVKANIRAMLNLANDPGAAVGEIANAMRFVNKLMEQHQLKDEDLSEVDDHLMELERKEMNREHAYFNGSKLCEWESSIASFCCELAGVKYYTTAPVPYRVNGIVQLFDAARLKQRRKNGRSEYIVRPQCVFYGIAEDVEIARQLFLETTSTIASLAMLKWGSVFRKDGREYCQGFAEGLWTNLLKDRRSQQALAIAGNTNTTKSTALVAIESRLAIVDKKKELAQRYLEDELKLELGKGKSFSKRRHHNSDARLEGRSDGQRHEASAERRKKLGGPS